MAQGSSQYRRPENTSNAGSDLKDKATEQFEKLADKATETAESTKLIDSLED